MIQIWKQLSDSEIRLELSDLFLWMENKKILPARLLNLAIAGLKILGQLEAPKFGNILCFW